MLILNELTLRRFRIHENLTLKFGPGVTGIVGRNGAGKSSVIEALGFLFTGEGDDPKEQIITAGQSGTAYVRGRFTLNGREGIIERALDTSRVMLEYDGQKFVKSGEVKELWAKLLQIDGHIFQHVIMAKQKRIPELFSGETAVREKAFQRIFMVPNTERLRSIIWENYIKTCPPPLPEDDLYALEQQITKLQFEIRPKEEKLALLSSSILEQHQMMAVFNYTEFYAKCIQDAQKRPQLESELQAAKRRLKELEELIVHIAEGLRQVPEDFNDQLDNLKRDRERHRSHLQTTAKLAQLKTQLQELGVNDGQPLVSELQQVQLEEAQAAATVAVLEAKTRHIQKDIDKLRSLDGAAICPTCHQTITSLDAHLRDLEVALISGLEELQEATRRRASASARFSGLSHKLTTFNAISARIDELGSQAELTQVDFDENKLCAMEAEYKRIQTELVQWRQYDDAKLKVESTIALLNEQLKHLVQYNGNATPAEDLTLMQEVLARHKQRTTEITALEKEVAQAHTEIHILEQRRATSVINHEKNLRQREYSNKLRMAYDVLHTSQFPRKLVQTYSSVVEEELLQQLQRFELPYQASINEDFRIIVSRDGHPVPRLSGGQEMVVGLCLRLALHSMFSQAFPMLVIDEGTTHLDEENKKLYFQCISDLKADKVIQQLIIVDHSSLLTDAVDHIIRL